MLLERHASLFLSIALALCSLRDRLRDHTTGRACQTQRCLIAICGARCWAIQRPTRRNRRDRRRHIPRARQNQRHVIHDCGARRCGFTCGQWAHISPFVRASRIHACPCPVNARRQARRRRRSRICRGVAWGAARPEGRNSGRVWLCRSIK